MDQKVSMALAKMLIANKVLASPLLNGIIIRWIKPVAIENRPGY
jgi:hypothetical protein